MNCNKRNKKLFTHIALAALMIFVLLIIVDTFFNKVKLREGLVSGNSFEEYQKKAINLPIDASKDADMAKKFKSYVDIYATGVGRKSNNSAEEEEKEKATLEEAGKIANILNEKLGQDTADLLFKAISTDPDSDFSKWAANNSLNVVDKNKTLVKNIFDKIDVLYKEIPNDNASLKNE